MHSTLTRYTSDGMMGSNVAHHVVIFARSRINLQESMTFQENLKQLNLAVATGQLQTAANIASIILEQQAHVPTLTFLAGYLFEQKQYETAHPKLWDLYTQAPHDVTLARYWTAKILCGSVDNLETTYASVCESTLAADQKALLLGHFYANKFNQRDALKHWSVAFSNTPLMAAFLAGKISPSMSKLVQRAIQRMKSWFVEDLMEEIAPNDPYRTQALMFVQSFFNRGRENGLQAPKFLRYPGLSARPFWPNSTFEWHDRLVSLTEEIALELHRHIALHGPTQKSYVTAADNAPASWEHLIEKPNWRALHLLKGGQPTDVCEHFPNTLKALQLTSLCTAGSHAPEAFFSILNANTRIPPHYGLSNFKLVAHLPIKLTPQCSITVGDQTSTWTNGELLVFDDSFLHHAQNDADDERVVFIFDLWHPELSMNERENISAIMRKLDRYYVHQPWLMKLLRNERVINLIEQTVP